MTITKHRNELMKEPKFSMTFTTPFSDRRYNTSQTSIEEIADYLHKHGFIVTNRSRVIEALSCLIQAFEANENIHEDTNIPISRLLYL